MASVYFYKARSFFLLDQMKYQRRISHLMTSGGKFHYVDCRYVDYINVPYNSSLEKKMGELVCYLLKCKKKIEAQK